ncbi:MAG: hypothetical protein IIA14_14540, partial [SAR324 cluster bacterium]|nr:hypothetical protein [SAR324 cluster bacterium]
FFIIFIVLAVIVAGLMWRFGRWALVVAAVWGFLNLWWGWLLVLSLSYPNSFFDFVLPLLLTVGALLAVVGAIVAFVVLWVQGLAVLFSPLPSLRVIGPVAVAAVVALASTISEIVLTWPIFFNAHNFFHLP